MTTSFSSQTTNTNLYWAFALDDSIDRKAKKRRLTRPPKRNLNNYRIISLSPKLKELGVRAGMLYGDAKKIMPEMRILICNR